MPPVELDTFSHVVTEFVHHGKDDKDVLSEPIFTRSKANLIEAALLEPILDDVEVPSAPVVTSEDLSVPTIAEPPREVEMMVSGFIDQVASYALVRTALKTVDYALNICEKVVMNLAPPATKYVQKLRRYLRVVRHAGKRHARAAGGNVDNRKTRSLRDLPARKNKAMREASITGYFADLFEVNFLLSFLGMEVTFDEGAPKKHKSDGHVTDDEESTVYKLMKEYDSQDDEDFFPSDSSEDSMEYESDSENETTEDKLNKHYPEHSDEEYVPSEEESKESIEYNSKAEVSQDAEESQEEAESQEAVDCHEGAKEVKEDRRASSSSVESTTVDKLMKDSEDDVSQEDPDYVPEEKSEDSCEYNSDEDAIKYDAQDDEPVEVADEASLDSDAPVADLQESSQDDSQEAPESQEDSQEVEELREDSQEVEELREDSAEVEELKEDSLEMEPREDSQEDELREDSMEELREDSAEVEELNADSPEMEPREDSQEEEMREDSLEMEELREDSHEVEEELREDSHEVEEELREDSHEVEELREDSHEEVEEELREDSHEEVEEELREDSLEEVEDELREDSHEEVEEELREDSHEEVEEELREDSHEEEEEQDSHEVEEELQEDSEEEHGQDSQEANE